MVMMKNVLKEWLIFKSTLSLVSSCDHHQWFLPLQISDMLPAGFKVVLEWSWAVVITTPACCHICLIISFKMIFIWNEEANVEMARTIFDVWKDSKNSKNETIVTIF